MPYSNLWDSNAPPGSQAANTADDEFRKLRLDLEERLESKFITDVVVDPWVVRPEILGNVAGKTLILHHSAFMPDVVFDPGTGAPTFTALPLYLEHLATDASTRIIHAALPLPVGITITELATVFNRNGSTNVSCGIDYNDFTNAPAITGVVANGTTANGIQLITTGIAHVVLPNKIYYLWMNFIASQPSRLYGVRVTYTTPDCRNTV